MIHMRLISSEWQTEQFDQAVKVSVAADVWRAWYVNLRTIEDDMTAIMPITCSMLQKWGVTLEQLEKAASENDSGSYSVRTMSEIMGDCIPDPDVAMYIVTNKGSFLGAAGIVASFSDWRKRGRSVKKGERGIKVIAPHKYKDVDPDTGDEKERLAFHIAHCFDISQTGSSRTWENCRKERKPMLDPNDCKRK